MDIEIKWNYGQGYMCVHLEAFLGGRSIARVRKLLKIIRTSDTPEVEQQLKEYVEQQLNMFELKQADVKRYIVGYTEKVRFSQKQLDNAMFNRDTYKRSTPKCRSDGWEHYNEFVKQFREELKEMKGMLTYWQREHTENVRNNDFLKKVLQVLTL